MKENVDYEWYCIHCGKAGWSHDEQGKLIGQCGVPDRNAACPLDVRLLEKKWPPGAGFLLAVAVGAVFWTIVGVACWTALH